MQEIRSVIFGDLTFKVSLDHRQIKEATVQIKGRSKEATVKTEDLKALYEWLSSLFVVPVEVAIKKASETFEPTVRVGTPLEDRTAVSSFKGKYQTGTTDLKSLGVEAFDRANNHPI